MRITNITGSYQRYADTIRGTDGLRVWEDSTKSYQLQYGERPDVVKSPKPVVKGWRPPLGYYATFTGNDYIFADVEVRNSSPAPNTWVWTNRGKLESYTDTLQVRVSEDDLTSAMPTSHDVDIAVVKARNNAASRAASFGESLVEARQSVQFLGTMAKNLDKFLIAAERKRWSEAARALGVKTGSKQYKKAVRSLAGAAGTSANAWLAFQFGIQPIISDMVSACILLGGDWSFRTNGRTVWLTGQVTSETTKKSELGYSPAAVRWTLVEKRKAGVHVRLDYELTNKYLAGFAKFGVSDVLQVAWAVVPYSFLVDFVLPVSEVLRSITATQGLRFIGGTATRFSQVERKSSNCYVTDLDDSYTYTAAFIDAEVKGRAMVRTVFAEEPNPITLWLKDPFDAFKVTTVFAVLAQRLLKLPSKG